VLTSQNNPNISTPAGAFALIGSDVDWAYASVPQPNTGDRVHTLHAGKAVGGGSVINYEIGPEEMQATIMSGQE
jgi:choline dehydrogenase-like flavoprotein